MGPLTRAAGVLAITAGLAACQSAPRPPATFINSAEAPAAAEPGPAQDPGAPAPGIAGGAVLGGIASSEIGRGLEDSDRQRAAQAEFYALEAGPAGMAQRWSNPQTGTSGTIVAGEVYEVNRSRCRDYTHAVLLAGAERAIRGTACRQPNGTWRSVGG